MLSGYQDEPKDIAPHGEYKQMFTRNELKLTFIMMLREAAAQDVAIAAQIIGAKGRNVDAPHPTIEYGEQHLILKILENFMSWLPSLQTDIPEAGFELAVKLSRMAVKFAQPDDDARNRMRPDYANNADSLTMLSGIVAANFQTVAQANNFWR